LRGTVVEFDDAKGYGTVEGDDGRRMFFHCTAIADGSRTISVGAEVDYEVAAGHQGRWEAKRLSPPVPSP
jgi:cold shock CspA family protein